MKMLLQDEAVFAAQIVPDKSGDNFTAMAEVRGPDGRGAYEAKLFASRQEAMMWLIHRLSPSHPANVELLNE